MASYPLREKMLLQAVRSILDQVDMLHLCMNDWKEVPSEYQDHPRVSAFVPEEDQKDVGKFVTTPDPDDIVFLVDDDLIYSDDYVQRMVKCLGNHDADKVVIGTHGSTYSSTAPENVHQRTAIKFGQPLQNMQRVDQLGTGALVALGRNIAPYEYMKTSQKFVDVRYARWLYENGIESWVIDREDWGFVRRVPTEGEHETIFKTFTRKTPQAVLDEIAVFAARVQVTR
ncbi:glycosyltransferase family A protein [Ruegeria atlantica]|uniref:glycosyltransferase family A protein n=2 Tax=Ruegeria atlantica TaxID=81569 RepID=UPI002493F8C9|nr:glycosyltransferase family A protein [Ruegeria atlantica]